MFKVKNKLLFIIDAAAIAAIYIVLTILFAPISFGIVQFRISEALTLLPALTPAAVPGLIIGCFISNVLNPDSLGSIDIIFGTLATALASLSTFALAKIIESYKRRVTCVCSEHKQKIIKNMLILLLPLPTVGFNAVIVGTYLPYLLSDFFPKITLSVILGSILSVGFGEVVTVYILGLALYKSFSYMKIFEQRYELKK